MEPESVVGTGADQDRIGVREPDLLGDRGPPRSVCDDLVAGAEESHRDIEQGLLAAGRHDDLRGPAIDPVVGGVPRAHRLLELGDAGARGVAGEVVGDGSRAGRLDVRRGREVGLPGSEVDDVHAPPAQPIGFEQHLLRPGRSDAAQAVGQGHRSSFAGSLRAVAAHTRRPLGSQPSLDHGRDEPRDRAAEREDLLREARAEVGVALGRHHEHGLDVRVQVPVHEGHLHLVLEVRDRTQTAHDDVGPALARVVDQQAVERLDLDVRMPVEDLAQDPDALVRRRRAVPCRCSPGSPARCGRRDAPRAR